jgi:hypothetical protein
VIEVKFFSEQDVTFLERALKGLFENPAVYNFQGENSHFSEGAIYQLLIDILTEEDNLQEKFIHYNNLLSDEGVLSLIVPKSFVSLTRFFDLRTLILDNYSFNIYSIIELNSIISSSLHVSIILLTKNEISEVVFFPSITKQDLFEVVKLVRNRNYKNNEKGSFLVEGLEPKSLEAKYYDPTLNKAVSILDRFRTNKLYEVADLFTGINVTTEYLDGDEWKYIRPRDIQNDELKNTSLYVAEDVALKYASKTLIEGDILISKHFGSRKFYLVKDKDLPAVASSGFIVIRAENIPYNYLYKYFTSSFCRTIFESQLSLIETGGTIRTINLSDIRELEIPILSKEFMVMISNLNSLPNTLLDELDLEINSILSR